MSDTPTAPRLTERLNLGWRRRRAVILQTEAAECGLACLAMVAGAHGQRWTLAELRQRFAVSLKGLTMADLVRMGAQLGLTARALRAEPQALHKLQVPCILHWDFNHFVVLDRVQGDSVVIHDPALGERRLSLAEVSKHFTGVALELRPGMDFARKTAAPAPRWSQLLGHVTGLKRSMAQILLLALGLELLGLLAPFLLQWTVDGVVVSADRDLLVTLAIGFGLLVLLQVGVGLLRSWAVMILSASLNLQWLSNVFSHLLRLPLAWFEKRHLGDIWSRFSSVQEIQKTL
ncbi:MAG: cysteine peptidase family C39 domain-containing protein, partial [Burkholderiaceae bacterium]